MSNIDERESPRLGIAKRSYEPPCILGTSEFETLALSCGKAPGGGTDDCEVFLPKLS